ncbi:hypothetical protein [Streptomyces sp. KR80]|uniref:hypothetical protein n=1 Tax=Streptomyces sp. KR80 TaxID=3457426 RepID=UPI003FD316B6
MVTVRPTSSLSRTRRTAAGLLRMSWLAALLLGLLYTHGVSGESAAAHMATGPASTAAAAPHAVPAHPVDGGTASEHSDDRHERAPAHHDDEAGHAGPSCLSGKPQQGADLPVPCTTPSVVPATQARTGALERPVETGSVVPRPERASAILRI